MNATTNTGGPPPKVCASSTPGNLAGSGGVELAAQDVRWAKYVTFTCDASRAIQVLRTRTTVPLELDRWHTITSYDCPVPPRWGTTDMNETYCADLIALLRRLMVGRPSISRSDRGRLFCTLYEARVEAMPSPAFFASPADEQLYARFERWSRELACDCDCTCPLDVACGCTKPCGCSADESCDPTSCSCPCCVEHLAEVAALTRGS